MIIILDNADELEAQKEAQQPRYPIALILNKARLG